MKTLDEELSELGRKFRDDEEKIRKKHDILRVVQERIPNIMEYKEPFIFYYKLYGSLGHINFSFHEFHYSTDKTKDSDKELFTQVIKAFPSINKVKVKDNMGTGFRPDETLEEKEGMDLYDCYDKTVRIEPPRSYSQGKLTTAWYTKIGSQIWEIKFSSKWYLQGLGKYKITYQNSSYWGEDRSYLIADCNFSPNYDGQILKYGRADNKTPNDFIVYWDKNSGEKVNFPEVMFEKEKR